MVVPAQTGLFELAVGVAGVGFMVTVTGDALLVQPLTVAVTLYVPALAKTALAILGF